MKRLLTLAVLIPLGALAADAAMSPSAIARYQDATAKIQARAFGEAIPTLNQLAAEYPRTAEVFAARCSAQVSMQSFAGAEADCTYALTVKPDLPVAIYTLAMAQEQLGKREAALASYRRYAAYDQTAAPYREQALARAAALGSVPPTPAPAPAPAAPAPTTGKLVVYRNHYLAQMSRITLVLDNRIVGDLGHDQYAEIEASVGEHLLEARGSSADGYDAPRVLTRPFQLGAATVYANFDNSGGQVILQELPASQARAEIQADCKKAYSRLITADSAMAPAVAVARPPIAGGAPECRMGSDGRQACGFNCRIGSDGVSACADSPNGVCAIGSNGRVTCSRVSGSGLAPAGPPPECKMSSRGVNTCGYNCRHGSRGDVYCASRPDGQCALNSDGTWSCP